MKVKGAVKLKHGTLHPGDEVLVNCRICTYIAAYYDEDRSRWMYIVKDPDDIWGGLMEVRELKHMVHHRQQEEPLAGQMELWERA